MIAMTTFVTTARVEEGRLSLHCVSDVSSMVLLNGGVSLWHGGAGGGAANVQRNACLQEHVSSIPNWRRCGDNRGLGKLDVFDGSINMWCD